MSPDGRVTARRTAAFRVVKTLAVPGNFDCRSAAKARTYLYKFAVPKRREDISDEAAKLLIDLPGEAADEEVLDHCRKRLSSKQRKKLREEKCFHLSLPLWDQDGITEHR